MFGATVQLLVKAEHFICSYVISFGNSGTNCCYYVEPLRKPQGRDDLGNLVLDGRIILKRISKEIRSYGVD
jgi:hypothetical protein